MPPFSRPFNRPPTAGVIAVSFAVAAAIAIYESEELQRITEDLRRRIAIALHRFGDSITPQERENLFNRPEDAEGFLESRGLGRGSVPGVDADAESLRRQREELMYWNAVRESKKEQEQEQEKRSRSRGSTTGSNFDDFLKKDENAGNGAFIYQTGYAPVNNNEGGVVRRRGNDGLRGLNYSMVTDPFADEHGIESDIAFENSLIEPGRDEMSDIYSATDVGAADHSSRTLSPIPIPEGFAPAPPFPALDDIPEPPPKLYQPAMDVEQPFSPLPPQPAPKYYEYVPAQDEYMTAGQEAEDENEEEAANKDNNVYSSIQAWAQNSASHHMSFYSPLPASPAPPASEASTATDAELITDGDLTPTDSASLAGSGVDVAADEAVPSHRSFEDDVMSHSSGMDTPTSWTDVESAVAESEAGGVHA
ncbi:hypothetical protein F4860DRAFT_350872 [Xylaria cubensis]|nr:hypothetical protein F4860DRAFT_350872 [Xylaria cubensis]